MGEFIYTMKNVRKAIGDKVILDNVTMAFYPGAKIGVVGPNGAGKSSILKIMAGLDQPSNGEAFLDPGATVGILLQEPPLNEEKTVRENVEEGLGDIFETLKRYNAIAGLQECVTVDQDAFLAAHHSAQRHFGREFEVLNRTPRHFRSFFDDEFCDIGGRNREVLHRRYVRLENHAVNVARSEPLFVDN